MIKRKLGPKPEPLAIARDYISRKWQPLPVAFRGKRPTVGDGWPNFRCDAESAASHFNGADQNIGVLLGTPSGNLVDVDLDHPLALGLAPRLLPRTEATFGRRSNPTSHYLYLSPDICTTKYQAPDGTVLVEIRSTGSQTVFPGSVHESGERIKWVSDGVPSSIAAADLRVAVSRLASAVLIASVWRRGIRDEASAALTGVLRRSWPDEQVRHFVGAIARAANDDQVEQRERKADRTPQHEYGWPKLREVLSNEVVNRIAEWLELDNSTEIIEEINDEYAVVPVGGKVVILHQVDDRDYPGTKSVEYWRQQDFHLKFSNVSVRVGEKDISASQLWLKSPNRAEYRGVVFEPGIVDTGGYFNLWRRWGKEPRQGSWQRLKGHIYNNVADGDERAGDWLIAFMADAIQNPNRPAGVSVVLQGDQGVGKGIVWNSFGVLFGRHYIQVTDPRHLVGNFNSHLADKLLIFVDEGFFAGDRRHAAVLKGMITEPRVIIEPKGLNAFTIRNVRRVVFASNEDWVIPAGLDERRFAVYRVNPQRSQNRRYFGAISHEMSNGGYEGMMFDLVNFDLTKVNVAAIPKTAALWDQKRLTLDAANDFWMKRLIAGEPVDGRPWNGRVPVACVVDAFEKSISNPYDRRAVETKFGAALRRLCPTLRVLRVQSNGRRERVYELPPLSECREAFEAAVRQKINWSTGEARTDE